jgi:hypothetical protein
LRFQFRTGNSTEIKRAEFNRRPGGVNERSPKSQNLLHQKQKVMARPSESAQNRAFNHGLTRMDTDFLAQKAMLSKLDKGELQLADVQAKTKEPVTSAIFLSTGP